MTDLTELYERDPLSLTSEDIDEVIRAYREMRVKFNLGDLRAGSVKKPSAKALAGADKNDLKEMLEMSLKI